MAKKLLLITAAAITAVAAVAGAIFYSAAARVEAADIQGYAQSAVSDYESMIRSLGVEEYKTNVEQAKEKDDEYDRQHPENKTSYTKNEMQAYAQVVSDGYGKLFQALKDYEFDKARVLAYDWTIGDGVGEWFMYRGPEYSHIDVSAIGQAVESYVPGANNSNDLSAKLNEKIAGFISEFTAQHDKKMNEFFKQACANPWPYHDDYKKEENKATFIYPKGVERKMYFPDEYRAYNIWYLSTWEGILNYRFWAEEGLGMTVLVSIWSSDGQEPAVSGMLEKYKMVDQSGDIMILEKEKYKDYLLIHNYKGRKCLAVLYSIDGAGELPRQMAFFLKDYLTSGAVSAGEKPQGEAELKTFKIEAMDKTELCASPGEPNTCRLKVSVSRQVKDESGKIAVKPAAGAAVSFEKPLLGRLSAEQAITDANGEAIVVYQAPTEDEMADKDRVSVDITARGEEPGEYDYMPVSVENKGGKISAGIEHNILPSVSKFYSRITFKFRGPNKEYKAIVSVQQKDGALVLKQDEQAGTGRLEMQVRPGSDNELFYHWTGVQEMTSARDDTVTIEIPELKLKQELSISVGIDLQPLRVENDWKGPALPGVFHPFKVYVNDSFHPKADAAQLFKKFYFKAHLRVNQDYYEPVTIYDPGKEDWLSRLLSHIEGAAIPGQALTNNLINAKLERSDSGDSFLIAEDWKEAKNIEAALPGAIPYNRGNYQFGFELVCEDDANKSNNHILSEVIDVEEYSVHGEMFNGFVVPFMKSSLALVPEVDLVLYSIDTGVNLQQGNYKDAIMDTAFRIGSDMAGDWVGDKGKEAMEEHFKQIIAKAKSKPVEQLSKKELEYCLRRAKEEYVADLGEAIAGMVVGEVKDKLVPEAEAYIKQHKGSEFLKLFLTGYGGYGLFVFSKDGIADYSVYDKNGQKLSNAPEKMFSGPPEDQKICDGDKAIVVPFLLGEEIKLEANGTGSAGNLITITPDNVTTQAYPDKEWQSKMQVTSSGIKQEAEPGQAQ